MRAVLINHCHPDTPHVCATRMREFANALSKQGHEIILLTEVLAGQTPEPTANQMSETIQNHNFEQPLFLASRPQGHPLIQNLRKRMLPWGIRQAVVAWYYFRHSGVFTDWRLGSQAYLKVIAAQFKPDIAWASFGNSDCWNIARDLAQLSNCRWIGDLKDPWGNFIPSIFRHYLSWRFNDVAALTSISEFHAHDTQRWFQLQPTVLYSGFSENLLKPAQSTNNGQLIVSLTGAIYDQQALKQLMLGIRLWLTNLPEEQRFLVEFVYAGHDIEAVDNAMAAISDLCRCKNLGYLSFEELQKIHRSAIANLYIKSNLTFHHKATEMLSAGRPLICYPGETKETIDIANSTHVPLHSCSDLEQLAQALDLSLRFDPVDLTRDKKLKQLSWEHQALKLNDLFLDVLEQAGSGSHG